MGAALWPPLWPDSQEKRARQGPCWLCWVLAQMDPPWGRAQGGVLTTQTVMG